MPTLRDTELKRLLKKAENNTYAPYSKFRVAAGGVVTDLITYDGVNIENASYGLTMCAERVAIYQAIMNLHPKDLNFEEILIVSPDGMPRPCGACLQVMNQFLRPATLVTTYDGKTTETYRLYELLPYPFEGMKK